MRDEIDWAEQTFGDAELGDARRTRRLVKMAAGLCLRPSGRVTRAYRVAAEREGAFRLLENRAMDAAKIAAASHRSTARRCSSESVVYVAVDSTTVAVADRQQSKFGRIGPINTMHRGMLVMNGLAIDSRGTTLGTTALEYWVRPEAKCPRWGEDFRPAHERESSLWRRAVQSTVDVMQSEASGCKPWFQMDRGADFGDVLMLAHEQDLLVTVRATYDRAIESESKYTTLWPRIQQQPVLGHLRVRLPARSDRPARIARLSLRVAKLRFRVAVAGSRTRKHWVEMTAVYAKEAHRSRDGIEWMLWTTHDVQDVCDACDVVRGYTMRWKIEEFHRAWKTGGCNIESSQLRSVSALQSWGAITAAVAARAEHLKLLSRSEPDRDAELELTRDEIDAAIILTETKRHCIGDKLTLQQAVALVAQCGGYTGRSSGGPPGTQTITRGLAYVATAGQVLAATRSG